MEPFLFKDILVEYNPEEHQYLCRDTMVGGELGHFFCEVGPGWVFWAKGGLIMDELKALAEFQDYLQSTLKDCP